MNSNLFHNIANIAMIVIAGVTAVLTAMGCTTLPSGELECSNITFLSPTVATLIITAIGVVRCSSISCGTGCPGSPNASRPSSDLARNLQAAARARRVCRTAGREARHRKGGAR